MGIIKLLLDRGANIEAKDSSGFTPLWFAKVQGDAKMIGLLIQYGTGPEDTSKEPQRQYTTTAIINEKEYPCWMP
jgi:ankyrin repeat protein